MRGSFRSDILWAYTASAAKVASWAVLSALLVRRHGLEAMGLLALVRATLGLLNYASAGLAPAIIHFAAKDRDARDTVFQTGIQLSAALAGIAAFLLLAWFVTLGHHSTGAFLVLLFGWGVVVRVAGDAIGAVLQSTDRLRTEYQLQALLEFLWMLAAGIGLWVRIDWQLAVGGGYLGAAVAVTAIRWVVVRGALSTGAPGGMGSPARAGWVLRLLGFGGLVVAAQVADFLYAPTDFILIRWLIDLRTVGVYTPAVQLDTGLSLAVSGLAAVMLPKAAEAAGRADSGKIWTYYVRGTLASFALLLTGAGAVWAGAPYLLKGWLGSDMPETRRILPLVLVSTVVGGSARVGGAVLLGMGRARPYAISVLVAGLVNVLVSVVLVRFVGMGLAGIVAGTMVAVVGRCAVWMPWYVHRVVSRH